MKNIKRLLPFVLMLIAFLWLATLPKAFGQQAIANEAYPPPLETSVKLPYEPYPPPETASPQKPTPIPETSIVKISFDVTVDGVGKNDSVVLQLLPDTENTIANLAHHKIEPPKLDVQKRVNSINVNIPVGTYKLIVEAKSSIFREPQGYLFHVSEDGIVRSSKLPFHFHLIPPSEQALPPCRDFSFNTSNTSASSADEGKSVCKAERIIDISTPPKEPEPINMQTKGTRSDGYHYAGPWTTQNNQGVRGRFHVVDANVDHAPGSVDEFVAERVFSRSSGGSWMEAGWAEVSWRDNNQYIYQYDSATYTWHFFDNYQLSTGTPVETLVRADGNDYWVSKIYWNGSWHELVRDYLDFTTSTEGFNRGEIYTMDGTHPILPTSLFDKGFLYIDNIWRYWDTRYITEVREDFPYECDMDTQYYRFTIHSPHIFLPIVLKNYSP